MKIPASAAFHSLRSSLVLPALVTYTAAGLGTARAADISWNVAGPAPWTNGGNWTGGVAPGTADRALILNGGTATIADGDAIAINAFRLVNGGLGMTGGSLTTSNTADYLRIGDFSFNATVGTATLTMSGSSAITAPTRLYIADGETGTTAAATTANVNLSGSASIKNLNDFLVIGRNHGTATVDLYGTSSVVKMGTTNLLIVGDGELANGTVTLHDPGTSVSSAGEIWVGNGANAIGKMTISAGTVTKAATGGSFVTVARANATGTLTVEGSGQLISNNSIRLAEGTTANATVTVKDSAVVQATNAMNVGFQGTGKLDISGTPQLTVGTELSVGTGSGKGMLLMSGGIFNANGTGTYVVGGGNLAEATVTLSGTSALNGGNMKWKTGDFGGTGNGGTTTITLNGSSALTLKEFTIGHIGGAAAVENVNVNATSTLTVNNFVTIGRDDANTNGSITVHLNLNGGTLATKSVRSGGGAPSATNNNVVGNGGTIKALGDQPDFFQATGQNATRPFVQLEAGGLTFNTNGFSVGLQNGLNGTGGFTKTGAGTLKLANVQSFTGATAVNQGTLEVDSFGSLAGALTIASGATLTTSGNLVGTVSVAGLTFAAGSSLSVQNLDPFSPAIQTTGSLSASGTVTVALSGTLAPGDYPLIDHSAGGAIGGAGIGAFQLAPLGRGVVASVIDSANVVTLHVTAVNPLVWKGNINSVWDINTTANWTLSGSPNTFQENDNLLFDDTATTTSVTLNAVVHPTNINFNNSAKTYTIGGTGSIAGGTGLTKNGAGMLTLATANTYTGATTVNDGTLRFGDGVTDGSITGPLVINDRPVVFNTTGTSTIAGAISGTSFGSGLSKTGAGTQVFTSATNTYSGPFAIGQGTVKFGNGTVNGALGVSTTYDLAAGTTLALDYATAINFANAGGAPWPNISGAGTVTLNSAQPVDGSANWGALSFSPAFTGTLQVLKGRVESATNVGLGGISTLKIADGSQFLAFTSSNPFSTPIQIAGLGWGEAGFNQGALRIAAGNTATWAGSVTLTADSGIFAQGGANFTISGSIAGAFVCQFYAQDNATLTLAPAAAVQNSYGTTRVNGTALGSVVAGNAFAFGTGPLEVNSSILKLNGSSFTFASLAGTGGSIGNYSASTPSVLTVGNAAGTAYAGTIINGAAAALSLVKNGAGTLTLTGANTYTGSTTIHAGTLSVNSAYFNDTAAVVIDSGAVINLATGAADTVGSLVLGGTTVPGGTYNSTHPTYGAYFTGTGSLVVIGASGYGAFAAAAGLTAANNGLSQDPDTDGISNLMEFYLNGNPLGSNTSILPAGATDATYLNLTFNRRDDAEADVATQSVEYGTTLAGWTAVPLGAASSGPDANGVIVTVAENGASPDQITVKIPRALAADGKLFTRLKVTK